MKQLLPLLLAVAMAASACSGDDTSTTTTTPPTAPPVDQDQRILEVRFEGGFAPVEFLFSQVPRFTLYADGRLVFEGPQPAIFPGPLMPMPLVTDIGIDGLSNVLAAVRASGLPDITSEVNNEAADFVADAPNTIITYTDENGDHVYSVYALGITEGDPQLDALQRIIDVLDQLAASATATADYRIERLQVIVSPAFNGGDVESTIEPWPLPVAAAEVPDFQLDLTCIVLDGQDAADALPIFQAANQLTFFEDAGTEYRLTVRPLLAGEEGCRAG